MNRSLGNVIADSLDLTIAYAERLQKGITPERFARFAAPGGKVVESNHPAFVFGHLSLYPARMIDQMGGDAGSLKPPEKFLEVFSKDTTCRDDPEGTIYPDMREICELFFNGYRDVSSRLRSASDEVFQQPNPMTALAERFPTLGSMHTFYAGGHAMSHLGQLSAWRRMEGMPPA